jgi:hypothetical protein
MPLRSGREYQKIETHNNSKKEFLKQLFLPHQQPINLILLKEQKVYKVNIDFDHASKMWRKNKISLGNGMFKYKNASPGLVSI